MVGLRDVITISEKGNGKGDCGKSRFVIDTVLNDARLTGLIPAEEVRKKFEVVNEGFGKRAAPWYIWLVFLPLLVIGLILVGIHGNHSVHRDLWRSLAYTSLLFSYFFFLYRTRMQRRFIKESFEDWKRIYGIETKYETKCCIPYTGMLYLKRSIEVK